MDAPDHSAAGPDGLAVSEGRSLDALLKGEMAVKLRAGFEERLRVLREAADDWGVKPDHPEGAFVSAMIGTQVGFVDVALSFAEGLAAAIADARAMAQESAEQQARATAATQAALGLAREAARVLDVEKVRVTTEMVAKVAPALVEGVRHALVIKEQRFNRNMEWTRAALVGAAIFALVIGGYTWRTVQDWSLLSRVSYENTALQRCLDTSKARTAEGHWLCDMNDFLPR